MNDEKYAFISDLREKKSTARSAKYKRTHNGKGGRVHLPSDHMTAKELKAMSGEVKSYKLNEPMTWAEFKAMPDDIKIIYIKLLREKYNVPDKHICKMMVINPCTFSQEMHRLYIPSARKRGETWDKEGFYAWCGGIEMPTPIEQTEDAPNVVIPPVYIVDILPLGGTLTYEGKVEDVLRSIYKTVKGNVRMTITWEAV